MSVAWPYLVLASALLIPPLPLPVRLKRALGEPRRIQFKPRHLWPVWQNWADLLRAGAGAYLLMNIALVADPKAPGSGVSVLIAQGVVAGLAVAIQSTRFAHGLRIFAPLFYLSGLTLGVSTGIEGIFAVAVGWAFVFAGKNLLVQMPAMAVALAVGGAVFELKLSLIVNCCLIAIPLFLALATRTDLAYQGSVDVSEGTRRQRKKVAAAAPPTAP